jgi:ParB-like nuclease domain
MTKARQPSTDANHQIPTGEFVGKSKPPSRQISLLAISELVPAPDNPRKHDRAQVGLIAKSITAFGFNAPLLIDKYRKIIAGHARFEAAKLLGLTHVPVVFLDHLTEAQAKAYRLADNQLASRSRWNDDLVAVQLKELSEILDFDIEAIGFELPELDIRIQSLDDPDVADKADEFDIPTGPAVSIPGDLWLMDSHRLHCANASESTPYAILMETKRPRPQSPTCRTTYQSTVTRPETAKPSTANSLWVQVS